MPSYLSNIDKGNFATGIINLFDTFKRNIVIFKEPIKTINSTLNNFLPGYQEDSNDSNYNLTPVSGVYPALIKYNQSQETFIANQPKIKIAKGEISIQVEEDCRNYIKHGFTQSIQVDGLQFNEFLDDGVVDCFTKTYYIFGLQRTN